MAEVVHRPPSLTDSREGVTTVRCTNDLIASHDIPLVLVPEIDIRRAVREAVENNGVVIEGSASASYAAITNDLVNDTTSRIGFIASGRNISLELLLEILQEPLA